MQRLAYVIVGLALGLVVGLFIGAHEMAAAPTAPISTASPTLQQQGHAAITAMAPCLTAMNKALASEVRYGIDPGTVAPVRTACAAARTRLAQLRFTAPGAVLHDDTTDLARTAVALGNQWASDTLVNGMVDVAGQPEPLATFSHDLTLFNDDERAIFPPGTTP